MMATETMAGGAPNRLALVRPLNLLVVAVGVCAGAALAVGGVGFSASWGAVVSAALAAALVAAGANAFNDYVDVDADRLNRPERPLPSGRVSRRLAMVVWVACSLGGVLLAWYTGPQHLLLAVSMVFLLAVYSMKLQRIALVGNTVVAVSVSATLCFGALAFGISEPVLAGAGFAFLTTLARELAKDVEDVAGDRLVGSQTLPALIGTRRSIMVAAAIVFVSIALVPAPYLFLDFSGLYLIVGLLAAAALGLAGWRLVASISSAPDRSANANYVSQASGLLKLSMLFGLVALVSARAPV